MQSVSVFCGSSSGNSPVFEAVAYDLGKSLAQEQIKVIYGGAVVGLMGAVANGALDHEGLVVGVLPEFLKQKEIAHSNLSEIITVDSMHERKSLMADLCEGVIMLPGGFGTLDEFFEMLTWAQLGLHSKPIALLNVDGFYDDLLVLLSSMVSKGFLKQVNYDMIIVSDDVSELIQRMRSYEAPKVGKWIAKEKS